MRLLAYVLAFACLLVAAGSASTEYLGQWTAKDRFKTVEPGKPVSFDMAFRGGKRACVIVEGDHEPVMDVIIKVFDKETGRLEAKDDYGGDFCSAVWYPPRDAVYRIEISINGNVFNRCYVSVK